VILSLLVGTFVHRIPARWLVAGSGIICACSPLAMALLNPAWNYWYLAFWAQVAAPFSADVLFTVGLIIVSDTFPEKTQALAGAVFNTVAQIGMSLGMGLCQVVALGVQGGDGSGESAPVPDEADATAVLKGYRASFWTVFAYMAVCIMVSIVGLRNVGKVGLKRE
jgi:MFS family permease